MPQILNFRKIEVTGPDREDLFSKLPFYIAGDATSAFRKWRKSLRGEVTDSMVKEWMLTYLAAKTSNTPGVGYFITLQNAVSNKRERPWKIHNIRNMKGPRRMLKTYLLFGDDGQVLGRAFVNKNNAIQLAKELILKGYDGNINIEFVKTCDPKFYQPLVARVEYSPSKNTHIGSWLCFGIESVV